MTESRSTKPTVCRDEQVLLGRSDAAITADHRLGHGSDTDYTAMPWRAMSVSGGRLRCPPAKLLRAVPVFHAFRCSL